MSRLLPRFRAFTLIELLTVIAIIGVLAAILIPVVGKVRKTARAAAALSGTRDLGLGVLAYANDNRGVLPPAKTSNSEMWHMTVTNLTGQAALRSAMVDPVFNARSGSELLSSPNHSTARCGVGMTLNPFLGDGQPNQISQTYGYTGSDGSVRPVLLNKVSDHSRRLMIAASNDWHFHPSTASTPEEWTPNADGVYTTGDPERHGDKAQYVFFDGSARMLTKAEGFWSWRNPLHRP